MAKQTYVNKSMVEIAEEILKAEGKKNIYDLMEQVAALKETSNEDVDKMNQLYTDMSLSAKFVFCGNDEWDLKENNLELWDKDGSYFNTPEDDVEEEEDNITVEDYYIPEEDEVEEDDEDDEDEDDSDDEDEIIIDEDALILTDDDDVIVPTKVKYIDEDDDDIDFDDEDYNEIMDDYEDMYDK